MTAAALAMRIHPRMALVIALLLALAAAVAVVLAVFHGVPVHGTEAMSYGGKTDMSYG